MCLVLPSIHKCLSSALHWWGMKPSTEIKVLNCNERKFQTDLVQSTLSTVNIFQCLQCARCVQLKVLRLHIGILNDFALEKLQHCSDWVFFCMVRFTLHSWMASFTFQSKNYSFAHVLINDSVARKCIGKRVNDCGRVTMKFGRHQRLWFSVNVRQNQLIECMSFTFINSDFNAANWVFCNRLFVCLQCYLHCGWMKL